MITASFRRQLYGILRCHAADGVPVVPVDVAGSVCIGVDDVNIITKRRSTRSRRPPEPARPLIRRGTVMRDVPRVNEVMRSAAQLC